MDGRRYFEYILAGNVKPEDLKYRSDLSDYYNFCKLSSRLNNKVKGLSRLRESFTGSKQLVFTPVSRLAQNRAGIFKDTREMQKYVKKLPPCSFVLTADITLESPYFSQNDEDFYLLDNNVLKEHVFKVPMATGSSWKGALAASAKKLVKEDLGRFPGFARIWGTGSNEFRELLEALKKNRKEDLTGAVISYALFGLGLVLKKEDLTAIRKDPADYMRKLAADANVFAQPHKGRAIFYSTFFNKLSFEVINPHDRRRRAGANPINYEVVPAGAIGKLQVVYIPYDAVLLDFDTLWKQAGEDLGFLCEVIERTAKEGIGAKTKLGWGSFRLSEKKFCIAGGTIISVEGWDKC